MNCLKACWGCPCIWLSGPPLPETIGYSCSVPRYEMAGKYRVRIAADKRLSDRQITKQVRGVAHSWVIQVYPHADCIYKRWEQILPFWG